jgi:Tol biopolymer transport system component
MSSKMSKKVYLLIALALLVSMAGNTKADCIFGTPVNLGAIINSESAETAPCLSANDLELYFCDHGSPFKPGGYGGGDLWVTTRQTRNDPWSVPVNLGSTVNSSAADEHPSLSTDGLTLYFSSTRAGGSGNFDLWVTMRATRDDPWQEPVNLGSTVNSTYSEGNPSISTDGLELYFSDFQNPRPGGHGGWDIYVTTRATVSDPWGAPVNLGPNVNGSRNEAGPSISSDGLTLFLNSNRSGGLGAADLWMTRWNAQDSDWEPLINLGPPINRSGFEAASEISPDGSMLYFSSERPGGFGLTDLWQVSIEPVVDLNADGIVNADDMCILVDHWGTDEPLYDIGPMPWGDGVVDVQDLIVLSEHLFEGVPPVE